MSNNRSLIVYAISGLLQKENIGWYTHCIQGILDQNLTESKVVILSQASSPTVRSSLQRKFGDSIGFNCIDINVPMTIAINSTVHEFVKRYGEYESYIYIDPKTHVGHDRRLLESMHELVTCSNNLIVTAQTSNDNGFDRRVSDGFVVGDDHRMSIGESHTMHVAAFSNSLRQLFEGRLMPDNLPLRYAESMLSFSCAAGRGKWLVMKDRILYHISDKVQDFEFEPTHVSKRGDQWNCLIDERDLKQIFNTPEAWGSGFGFDERNQTFMHNSNAYDENGDIIDANRLREFLLNTVYIRSLNYDSLPALVIR